MGKLLLILFLIFVVIPAVRLLWRVYLLRRQYKKMQENARAAFEQQFGSFGPFGPFGNPAGAQGNTEPRQRRRHYGKKISNDTGEYVNFEELPPLTDRGKVPPTEYTAEEQIVDVEWEDIR